MMRGYVVAIGLLVPAMVLPEAARAAGSGTIRFEFYGFGGIIAEVPPAAVVPAPFTTPLDYYLSGGRYENHGLFSLPGFSGVAAVPNNNFFPSNNPDADLQYVVGNVGLNSAASVYFRFANVGVGVADEAPGFFDNNLLSFAPATFSNVEVGQPFLLGTLTYKNGFWHGARAISPQDFDSIFDFAIITESLDGPQYNQRIDGTITHVENRTPYSYEDVNLSPFLQRAEADWIHVRQDSGTPLGSLRVYDFDARPAGFTNTGSIELWGAFGSLDLVELRNPQGGFFTSSITQLAPGNPVPEPASWAMLIAGFGLVGSVLRRRRAVPA